MMIPVFAFTLLQAAPEVTNCASRRAEKVASARQSRHGKGLWIGGIAFSTADIASAKVARNQYTDEPVIDLQLTPSGRIKFARAQACRLNRTISIWLDKELISKPLLVDNIGGVGVIIAGSFTVGTAEAFARRMSPTPP
jgi:preprotein translocase subunit SecD